MEMLPMHKLSAFDICEAHELLARYDRALDARDKEGFLSLFTDSGVWVSPILGTLQGRDQLEKWCDQVWAGKEDVQPGAAGQGDRQHRVANVIIDDASEDRIVMWSNFTITASAGGPRILGMGKYLDELVKVEGRWFFQKRTIEITVISRVTIE